MTELNINVAPRAASAAAPSGLAPNGLYLETHQSRTAAPTVQENAIADVIERLYAAGVSECEPIVVELNKADVPSPDGKPWTSASFQALMKELGA